jgi:hypothetical protein
VQEAGEEDAELQGYLRAVLLAYLASQNRSLFAARCLIQTVLEAHRSGVLSQLESLGAAETGTTCSLNTRAVLQSACSCRKHLWCAIAKS